jgi:phospholipase/carboxylesterase
MVTHGTRDPVIGIDRARDSRDRLAQMGVEADYREYEMEHSISPEALRDIVGFLDERAFGEAAA